MTSDHFFCLPNEEACLKQPLKTLSNKEIWNKHKEKSIKNKRFSDLLYCYFIMQSLFNVYKN